MCSEKALRRLEEEADPASHPAGFGPSRSSLLGSPTPAREALFALRVELMEAFLHRILPPSVGGHHDRPARVLRAAGLGDALPPPLEWRLHPQQPRQPAPPRLQTCRTQPSRGASS